MFNPHAPKPEEMNFMEFSDSDSDEEIMQMGPDGREGQEAREGHERVKGQDNRYEGDEDGEEVEDEDDEDDNDEDEDDDDEDDDDEDDDDDDVDEDDDEDKDVDDETGPSGSDVDFGAYTIVKLHHIHSGMTQPTLKKYINEHTNGLKKIEMLCVEKGTHPQTQTATLHFDSATAARGAIAILSRCPLGPGGSEIKINVVDLKEMQQPLDDGQQSPVKDSVDKKKRRKRRQQPWQRAKKQEKTQEPGGGIEKRFLVTLEVKNISVKREEFEILLTRLKITSFQYLQWKTEPQGSRAFLLFEKEERAVSAQQVLNNCSVGAANKKLVAVLQCRPIKNHDARQGVNQRGGQYYKKGQAPAASLSAPGQTGNVTNVPVSERRNRYGNDGRKFFRGGHTRVDSRSDRRQSEHHHSPGGACYISPNDIQAPVVPPLMGLLQLSENRRRGSSSSYHDDRGSFVSDRSNTGVPPMVTSLDVTNIDTRVDNVAFWKFLRDIGIPFKNLDYRTSRMQERYAVIYFATAEETAKSIYRLNNRWILPGGPRMCANLSTSQSTFSYKTENSEDRQRYPHDVHDQSPQHYHPRGNRGRGQRDRGQRGRGQMGRGQRGRGQRGRSRSYQRTEDDGSDKLSESSEAVSIASRKSFSSSTRGGMQPVKTSSLHITNIGEGVDEKEFCDFLESLALECKCLDFRNAKTTNTQFAVIQFPNSKQAACAKTVLNDDAWKLGNSDSPIKASLSTSKQPRGGASMGEHLLEELEGGDESQSNVNKWLEENEALTDDHYKQGRKWDGRHDYDGRGRGSQGRGFCGNYHGRGYRERKFSGKSQDGHRFSPPDISCSEPDESNQMKTDSQTDCEKGDFAGQRRNVHERALRGNRHGQRGHDYFGRGQVGPDAESVSSYTEHDEKPEMRMTGAKSKKSPKKSGEGAEASNESPDKSNDKDKREPLDLDLLPLILADKKTGNHLPHPLTDHKQEPNPKEVVITGLPRDITELDIVDTVKKEECQGFIDARLIKSKDPRARTSKCFLKFRERTHAMDAVLKLYGKPLNGHRTQVHLCTNHEQMEPAIARKTFATFQKDEMPDKIKKIQCAIEGKIENISSEATELRDAFEENQSFAELERCESSIAALEHQLGEQQRYLDEFKIACDSIQAAIDKLQAKGVSALSEVQKIRHHFERECRRAESPLPVYGYRSKIQDTIRGNQANVLQGETGSGKSTQIPQYIVDMELQGRREDSMSDGCQLWRVVCTQPRRVAALTLAKRVAEEYGCRVGEEIGFFVGNKRSVNTNTVVTFMTDRKLLNLCIADPNLSDYTCVIVDEAHERSVDTDILLATLKKLLKKRSDLHLLVMSATINIKLFTNYLDGSEHLSIPGRTFPVDKHWCGDDGGIGEGDYVGKAVQHAAKVHKNEGAGDILVFLTSANEIETACRDLATTLGQRPNDQEGAALILPLHGRLQPEDQMKVFAEARQAQRKIVFATNVAETSVTIKGMKYVIDCGVVKECQYDPKRSMSLLKVTTITRASAEQRAGRAGRTAPGVCYRLYTKEEYSEMEETMKPEILRVHLGMAALQLLELGVEDVENFDFIEAPDREATKQAMTTLRLLGAVDAQAKMTALGRKMATLSLEPRLSKLVLEGAERGVAMEAVVLAALISASGSIFYRGGSDKDKEKADRLKLQFCHESGDIITMLNAYGQWNNQSEKKQKAWCLENSMNSKTLRATKETVKEVCQVLKREHGIDCNYNDKIEAPDKGKSEMLQKVIMSGYFQTLSLYNGHHRAGYTVLAQQKSAHIHPSAALRALGINPKWVLYEEFKRTSRDFLFTVTQVDISWLEEVAPVFYNEVDVETLQEKAMEELPPILLGTALMRQLSVRRNEKLRALEEKITTEQDSPCIIEINRSMKELHMFVSKRCSLFATCCVQGFLDDERKMIEQQQIEVPVGESGVVRQVVIAGGETRFVLMAKDYRALEIGNMPADATEDDIERIIRFAGCSREEILDVYRFPKQSKVAKASKWGRVTFVSPEAAECAKEWLDVAVAAEETSLSVRELQGRGFQKPDIRRVNSRVVITWFTWPSKGHAYIDCETTEDAIELKGVINALELKGSFLDCNIKRNDTRALFIKSVGTNATQEELEAAIKRKTSIPFKRCSIAREPPKEPIPTPAQVTRDIYRMFDGVVEPNKINIDVLPVRSEKTQMHRAIVTFSGDSDGPVEARIAHIQRQPQYNSAGQMYHVKVTASCILFCRPEVYRCLEEDIDRLVETARNDIKDLNIRVNKSKKTSDWMISISGGKIEDVQAVRRSLLTYVQGETVPLTDVYQEEMPYQKKTRVLEKLRNGIGLLLKDLGAHATVDTRRQVIVIFGEDRVRERSKLRLRDYVQIVCDNMLREISLTAGLSSQCTKGRAIRALVRAYGPWLKKLQDESKATHIMLNIRQGVLLIEGDGKVFDTVHDLVKNCLKEAGLEDAISVEADESTSEEVECGICYTPVEGNDEVYRLSACSHGFHEECLKEMFTVRLKDGSKDYPIECPSDSCGAAMLLCDIRILCPVESKRLRLFQWALEAHVTQKSNGKLKFCPTADCRMIYKPTDDAQTFVCPECRGRLCSSCGGEPHSGQTCQEFKISGKDFDDIERWMKASGSNVKKCPLPHCGSMIEKMSGCNHMECVSCKKHICWVCLQYFDKSGECYGHLAAKHGGY